MKNCRRKYAAFTLLELLIVLAVIGILVGAMLPHGDPKVIDQLRSTAQIIGTEFAYGRSLAMSNGSTYKFTFDIVNNRFTLAHSGANSSLNQLPRTPFSSSGDTQNQHVTDLDELPHIGPGTRIAAVKTAGASPQNINNLEFDPFGATTRSVGTVVWLAAGSGANEKFIPVSVDPVTGVSQIGEYSSASPP